MKRESEKITEEIGPRDGPRDRHDRRRADFDSRSSTHAESPYRTKVGHQVASKDSYLLTLGLKQHFVSTSLNVQSSPISHPSENGAGSRPTNDDQSYRALGARGESGEISRTRDHHVRRGDTSYVRSSPPRDSDIGRERDRGTIEERGRGRTESSVSQLGRSSEKQQGSDVRRRDATTSESHRATRDETRSLGARWSRGDVQLESRVRGSKRSRPSSPETGNEGGRNDRGGDGREIDRDSRLSKRQRTASTSGLVDYDSKRASSPPRRRGSPPPQRSSRRTRR